MTHLSFTQVFPTCIRKREGLFLFVRAQLSGQVATLVDFFISIVLNQWYGVYYVYATLTGSVSGGLINCAINYKWTFRTTDCSPSHVLFKYVLVWMGSIGLNLWGTFLLTEFLKAQTGYYHLNASSAFIASKVAVSAMVTVLWSYNLHRKFVFRNSHLKSTLKRRLIKRS